MYREEHSDEIEVFDEEFEFFINENTTRSIDAVKVLTWKEEILNTLRDRFESKQYEMTNPSGTPSHYDPSGKYDTGNPCEKPSNPSESTIKHQPIVEENIYNPNPSIKIESKEVIEYFDKIADNICVRLNDLIDLSIDQLFNNSKSIKRKLDYVIVNIRNKINDKIKRKKNDRLNNLNRDNNNRNHLLNNLMDLSSKKGRPNFIEEQRKCLLNEYSNNRYPTRDQKFEIADRLNLNYQQVSDWFSNKRTREANKKARKWFEE
eukprot:GHVP01032602.1.p1 GENE.GHVP01032602.1~~GHVP01032602.1.p1  ORF type:complete len:262 (+),score=50.07 GHVP01032602.1:2-787(+)